MRQHNILTRALLILSITNFAFAAPVEARLDADVTRNVGALSPKWDADDEGELPLPNVPEWDHAPPPSPDLTDIMSQIASTDEPPTLNSPGGYVPPHLDHAPLPSPDVMSQIAYTRWPLPGSDHVLPPVPSPGHLPPPSPGLEHLLSQISFTDPPTPNSPGSLPGSDHMWSPVPSSGHAPPGSIELWSQKAELAKELDTPPPSPKSMPVAGSLSPLPPLSPHPSQPGPSEGRFPPGFEEFFKGKIKRRIDSSFVNVAQKEVPDLLTAMWEHRENLTSLIHDF